VVKFLYLGSFLVALMWEDDRDEPIAIRNREGNPGPGHVDTWNILGEPSRNCSKGPMPDGTGPFIYGCTPEKREDRQIIDKEAGTDLPLASVLQTPLHAG
jgi:hypothetical protein